MTTLKEAQAKAREEILTYFHPMVKWTIVEGEDYAEKVIDTLIAQTRTDLLDTLEREMGGEKVFDIKIDEDIHIKSYNTAHRKIKALLDKHRSV